MHFSWLQRLLRPAVWLLLASRISAETQILNVSFDISREFYQAYNPVFAEHWKKTTGQSLAIAQSHAGSSKQARAVIDGLEADVVTLNQVIDMDQVASKGLVSKEWRKAYPHEASPFLSTIVFLVRKGNPRGIRDWNDLVRPDVSVVVPNPKTSGNGRYSYLSAYVYALKQPGGDEAKAREFVGQLFKRVPVLDVGGRGATTTFVQREIGDVLLTFEAEVYLTIQEMGRDKFDVVVPSLSIEAELPVAVVEPVAKRRGTLKASQAYLDYLFSEAGQEVAARNFYRPRSAKVAERHAAQFPKIELFRVESVLGDWAEVQRKHFSEGGLFDQIYSTKR